MAKQRTVYMTTDSKKDWHYRFWTKKPKYFGRRLGYVPYQKPVGIFIRQTCKSYVEQILGQKLTKRGMKKLTIKIEDVE